VEISVDLIRRAHECLSPVSPHQMKGGFAFFGHRKSLQCPNTVKSVLTSPQVCRTRSARDLTLVETA
jgi:hypothetical protein